MNFVVQVDKVIGLRKLTARPAWLKNRLLLCGMCLLAVLLLIAIVGPFFAPYPPNAIDTGTPLAAPSASHLMGTDQFGRDYFSRWLSGSRVSLLIALCVVALSGIVGTSAGMVAGYCHNHWPDTLIMRIMDGLLSIPLIVLVIAITGTLGASQAKIGPVHFSGIAVLVFVLALGLVPAFTRVARATALAEMQEDYVAAARGIGAPPLRIIVHHLLPNVLTSAVIQASFSLAIAIGAEATVSFLGYGVQPPAASLGNLLNGALEYIQNGAWWLIAFPSMTILLLVLAFNLIGDGLRDVLDPRDRIRVGQP
jgi:ABC-type dipeptide/oligopeptide/nickel transport system permease subunit